MELAWLKKLIDNQPPANGLIDQADGLIKPNNHFD
jgi:hypothetical protein